ncbi:hypothetical protein ACFV7Q_02185 [Streptomyces sp. NPDC059851]|uniref:hypothetical protein n=1 Tax=Streptomyces sp. NPDC059851 TaxID=3346971 RepID=UPI00366903B8
MARTQFPDDLLLTQIRVIQTYAALARQHRGGSTRLRRALIHELRLLYAHPYWTDTAHSYADLVELRRLARARAWVEAA